MKAFWKDIFREIKNTRGKFISLLVIAALGAASVVGIQASSIDMRDIADTTYKEHNLYDIQVKSSTGFGKDDIAVLRGTQGVETVMPTYIYDVFVNMDGRDGIVRTYAIPDMLNTVDLLEGRLPETESECVVEQSLLDDGHYNIGDMITLETDDKTDSSDVFNTDTFFIVGTISSPLYISSNRGATSLGDGSVGYFLYLHPDAYALEVYTDVYLLMNGSQDMYNLSDDYSTAADGWQLQIEQVGNGQVQELKSKLAAAQTEIDDGWAEYYDGLSEFDTEIAAARQELDDALVALNDAKTELEKGPSTLDSQIAAGLAEINTQANQLNSGRLDLDTQKSGLADSQMQLDGARQKLNAGLAQLEAIAPYGASAELDLQYDELYQSLGLLDAQQTELTAGWSAIEAAQAELDFAAAQIVGARTTLESERVNAQTEIDTGWAEYNLGLEEYTEGLRTFELETADAQQELENARIELEDAQQSLNDAPEPEWYYFTRQDGVAFESYYQDTLRLQKIGYVFPVVFFLVAVLVSLTTMSRMVEENRTQIGVYAALGYRPGAIMMKYLMYAFGASAIGGLLGVIIGSKLFPVIISQAYGHMYALPPVATPVPILIGLVAILAAVASIVLVTLWACAGSMKSVPAELMRPKAPANGKRVVLERIPFLWKRMGFFGKVTARNIFRYKKRFVMTLVGVAGCSALLLTAFGLRDSVGSVSTLQYDGIVKYDTRAYTKEIADEAQYAELAALSPESHMFIREESIDASWSTGAFAASVIIPETEDSFTDYINLRDPDTGAAVTLEQGGILITEKLARVTGVSVGQSLSLTTTDGAVYSARVDGIVENYVQHFVYMSPVAYSEVFGSKPLFNSVLALTDNEETFASTMLANDNVRAVIHTADLLGSLHESTDALGIVTIVLLILACSLAFVVLFNLTNINISERIRELATIKVLGFQDNELSSYVYRENGIVTALGIALGLVAGIYLDRFVLKSAEIDLLKFPLDIQPMSFVLAAVLTMAFAIFVNLVMKRRLAGINMVESLKNVE